MAKKSKSITYDHALAEQTFRALVAIDRPDDDLHLEPGDTFSGGRFQRFVLENWLGLAPQPAIEAIEAEGGD